ncbi:hybrid sensor histidine kinase/response regulator [Polaribacter ponticola]|uniref:histidine kinase n=1 Tax=Polaribacter ponticola TaxID=2978475 RepID=A0ABT5SD08_9FLAO|nr:ATP-binding protein [Polaribacter sp. MSW5]MDD7916014.1 ATP-binding protein [Polaribacter sp. MSW5]
MILAKIDSVFIELTTDFKGIIIAINAGRFVKDNFTLKESIFTTCPFLIGTLEALPLKEPFSMEGMVVSSNNKEYNIDLDLFKSNESISVLIHDRTNVYKFVDQLNQSRNDVFFVKREIVEKNKELARLRKVADKANEEKTRFLAMMSHEVRNPLNSILGYTDMISEEVLSNKVKEYVGYLSLAGKNLNVIVNDILDLSRIEAGKLELVSEEINIKEIINNCFINFKDQQKNKEVVLSISTSNVIPDIVLGDEVRVVQVLSNLLNNALKFTNTGFVSLVSELVYNSDKTSEICFKIIDTGRGMTDEQTAKIFEEYQQNEINDNRVFGGAGLGLSIVKRLVEAMNGTISVFSELNVGTTFSVEIPFKKVEKFNGKRKEVSNVFDNNLLKGKCILVADDDFLNQKITTHFLQKVGVDVTIVNNGLEALNILNKKHFDVVLLDINMPEISGEQLIQKKLGFKKINKPLLLH